MIEESIINLPKYLCLDEEYSNKQVIDIFENNGEIILLTKHLLDNKEYITEKNCSECEVQRSYQNSYFQIFFITSSSFFYCINDCGSGSCNCKDKDWMQGTWNGLLLRDCDDKLLSINIFNFLKHNFNFIKKLNRYELSLWFESNIETFINQYYSEKIHILKIFVKYFFYLGIFNVYFYENFKKIFINKYKELLDIKFEYSYENYDKVEIILKNNLSFFINLDYTNSNIQSLQEKSYYTINNIKNLYNILSDKKKFIFIKNNIDYVEINDIKYFFNIIKNYSMFDDFKYFFKNLQQNKPINYFLKINNLDNKLKDIFSLDCIIDLYYDFEQIYDTMNLSRHLRV
jgi:hypothetical protein